MRASQRPRTVVDRVKVMEERQTKMHIRRQDTCISIKIRLDI